MKKSVSMYGRVTPQKKTEAKPTGRPAQKGSAGQGNGVGSITPGAAAKDRRSPVVTDQTIATNSVIQAANDPKIKELVIKQQMMDRKQRESMEKKRPRGDLLTGAFLSLEHSGGFASSGHHSSHSGQFFYKHSSFDETSPAAGDHHFEGDRGFVRYPPSSPEVHHPSYAPHVGATPGSFTETVVQTDSGSAQLDDVNSELTADAGYMSMQKCPAAPVTRMEGIPSAGVSPLNGMASSPSMPMHMYMDMNASLLHDPHKGAGYSGTKLSPHHGGAYGSHLPPPPPLTLPQASHAPLAGNGHIPTRVHTAYEAATAGSAIASGMAHLDGHTVMPNLPDPKELDDSALQAFYFKFLLEMETRGLHSMSLNSSSAAQNSANERAVPMSLSSSSSCMGGVVPPPISTGVNCIPTVGNTTRTPSPALAASPGSQHSFLAMQMAEQERTTSTANTPRAGASAGIAAAKTAPTTAHTTVPNATIPANPADIRKHVKRSKSGGSEASFYPNSLFPGGVAPANGASMPPAGSSGRRTPSSPMVNRYLHSSGEGGFMEPEDVELRNAFGHSRYPGSPSNLQYSGPSPSYLSSNAPATSYLAQHHSLSQANGHSGFAAGNHSHGTTPTGSAPGVPQVTTTTTTSTTQGRSASRCSGVAPPLAYDGREDLLDLRPAVRNNCLSTLPPTYSQYMHTAPVAATNAPHTTTNEPAVVNRSVVLKAPKFVRKLQEGMLLGMTGNAGRDDDGSSQGDASSASSRGARGVTGQSQGLAQGQSQPPKSTHQFSGDLRATAHANQHDNSVDAVLAAGGLDQLLLPARALIRGGSLISDNHSAFSHGSMSSLRSNGKKSPKTRQ
eukprot:gene12727-14699_t